MQGPDDFGDYTICGPDEALAIAAVVNGEMRRMGGKTAEHQANAHLIAAAPNLYAALERQIQLLGGWRELICELEDRTGESALCKAILAAVDQIDECKKESRQALAKARGEG